MQGDGHELDSPDLATMMRAVLPRLERFLAELDQAPADGSRMTPTDRHFGPPPETPTELASLLETTHAAVSDAVETAGPWYFGYIPAGGLPSSAIGEFIARIVNRFTGVADLAGGLVALEDSVVRWMTSTFGLPSQAGGLMTTGGSQAILSMMLAARDHHLDQSQLTRGCVYLSDQAHRSARKAAHIAGLPRSAVRFVPTTDGRHINPAAARTMIDSDRAAGLEPFLLIGSAGTTNSGSVDDLDALASLAAEQNLWYHVDGCYGGFFLLTERGRRTMAGIERADSISLDPHKSLFLPYGTGALLVRNAATLAGAHSDDDPADYLQDLSSNDLPDYADHSIELTREHRGLRIWLPLHLHGTAAFRAALNEKLDLARHAHEVLSGQSSLEVPESPELSTVVFRLRAGGDEANRELFEKVNATNRLFWSSTRLDGKFTLRLCILSFRTHREHVDEALETIRTNLPE